jgi:hypothetical protein
MIAIGMGLFLRRPDWKGSTLRPENALDLEWMLPAPAQGAIMVVAVVEDDFF